MTAATATPTPATSRRLMAPPRHGAGSKSAALCPCLTVALQPLHIQAGNTAPPGRSLGWQPMGGPAGPEGVPHRESHPRTWAATTSGARRRRQAHAGRTRGRPASRPPPGPAKTKTPPGWPWPSRHRPRQAPPLPTCGPWLARALRCARGWRGLAGVVRALEGVFECWRLPCDVRGKGASCEAANSSRGQHMHGHPPLPTPPPHPQLTCPVCLEVVVAVHAWPPCGHLFCGHCVARCGGFVG